MNPIKVLIVDDSATIRGLLKAILTGAPDIEVVGTAPDALTARSMIKELNPDVLTLDIEMPNMSGLEFLEKIMRLRPMPVVMISTLTQRGAEITLQALEIGAVDYFPKPTENVAATLAHSAEMLAGKIRTAASARVRPQSARPAASAISGYLPGSAIVGIGSSTGGVEALINILSRYPENCPPTVITQHMPANFTTSFARRLDGLSRASVKEAADGDVLMPGHVYLAPGSDRHLEVSGSQQLRCHLRSGDTVSGHRPSVDVLFASIARCAGADSVGVILTGMGRDGAVGLGAIRKAGGHTIGQDEASCVVYGMPRSAFEIGAVAEQLSLDAIGDAILKSTQRLERSARHACSR